MTWITDVVFQPIRRLGKKIIKSQQSICLFDHNLFICSSKFAHTPNEKWLALFTSFQFVPRFLYYFFLSLRHFLITQHMKCLHNASCASCVRKSFWLVEMIFVILLINLCEPVVDWWYESTYVADKVIVKMPQWREIIFIIISVDDWCGDWRCAWFLLWIKWKNEKTWQCQ